MQLLIALRNALLEYFKDNLYGAEKLKYSTPLINQTVNSKPWYFQIHLWELQIQLVMMDPTPVSEFWQLLGLNGEVCLQDGSFQIALILILGLNSCFVSEI